MERRNFLAGMCGALPFIGMVVGAKPEEAQVAIDKNEKIRIWTLGNIEHQIYPTEETCNILAKRIQEWKDSGEDEFDLIWGPDLTVQEIGEGNKSPINIVCPTIPNDNKAGLT